MYLKNSQVSLDLPIPAMPEIETRCGFSSSAAPWKRSLIRRSSRSRPTNGASRLSDFSEPRAPETTRKARQRGMSPDFPFSPWLPGSPGALGVSHGLERPTTDRHYRVAYELLDRTAIALDEGARRVEVTRQKFTDFLRVA